MKFFRSMLSEGNQGSFSRLSGFLIILGYLIYAAWIVSSTMAIPDLPPNLMMLVVGLYGINRIAAVLEAKHVAANRP